MQTLQINKEIAPWLRAAGCETFDQLMSAPVGELASEADRQAEARKIVACHEGVERTFYLKRSRHEEATKLLKCLMRPTLPSVGAMREVHLLRQLNAAGFETMQPVAWGQRSTFGWPSEGFMVCEAIDGVDLHQLYQRSDQPMRLWLQQQFGKLVGKLHAAGFFQPVRQKDLICGGTASDLSACRASGASARLVLIDRATSKPWPTRFSLGKCQGILSRTQRRIARDGQVMTPEELQAFAEGYCDGLGQADAVKPAQVVDWLKPIQAAHSPQAARA